MRRSLLVVLLAALGSLHGPLAAQVPGRVPTRVPAQVPTRVPRILDGTAYDALEGSRVQVLFEPADSATGARVLAFLEAQPPLPGLPDSLPRDVRAVMAHTRQAFDGLTGGQVPEWGAGVAVPSLDLLVIPGGQGRSLVDEEGRRVLRHEWAHLGLHQYLGELRVPRWFDEGYAQYAAGGWDYTQAWRLRVLLALGRAPAMDSLTLDWPRDRASADAAYLLAASAVGYLLHESGDRGLEVFLARWRADGDFETALRATFGVSSGQMEEDWRGWVRAHYGWLFVLSRSAVFWMALTLILLLMFRSRHTRNRERLARLRAGEMPDLPAYWEADDADHEPQDPPPGLEGPP